LDLPVDLFSVHVEHFDLGFASHMILGFLGGFTVWVGRSSGSASAGGVCLLEFLVHHFSEPVVLAPLSHGSDRFSINFLRIKLVQRIFDKQI
jgi:hypothetical protein